MSESGVRQYRTCFAVAFACSVFLGLGLVLAVPGQQNGASGKQDGENPREEETASGDKSPDGANSSDQESTSTGEQKGKEKEGGWGVPLIEQIQRLIHKIEQAPKSESRAAQKELLRIGRPAIPQLESKIRQKNALKYYELIQQIRLLSEGLDQAGTSSDSKEEKEEDGDADNFSVKKEKEKLEASAMDPEDTRTFYNLLEARYRDALNAFESGKYRRARKLAEGILQVAPDHPLQKRIQNFVVKCKEHIVQSGIVQTSIAVDRNRYEWGETVKVVYRIKNVSDERVELHFDGMPEEMQFSGKRKDGDSRNNNESDRKQTEEPRQVHTAEETAEDNVISVEAVTTEWNLLGRSMITNEYRSVPVPRWINLAPGATWEARRVFKTSSYEKNLVYREVRLRARVRPALIRKGKDVRSRWLRFHSDSFQIFPEGMRKALPATVKKMKKRLRAGIMTDVFFLGLLLPDDRRTEATTYFLKVLPHLKKRPARTVMFLLRRLTGRKFHYRVKRWVKWGKKQMNVDPSSYDPSTDTTEEQEERDRHFERENNNEEGN